MFRRPSINPVVWQPPPAPPRLLGRTRPTLPPLRLLFVNGLGPEDVCLDRQGRLVTGLDAGRIIRLSQDGRRLTEIADTRARPLGIALLPDDRLVVCDAYRGLLRVDPEKGAVDVLADRVEGAPMQFCKNAAVASDGTIYFSDASTRFGFHHWKADLLEHSGTGRLLRLSPGGEPEVLVEDLQLANGVVLTPDETAVLVAETGSFRILRHWLAGPSAGTSDVLTDDLPGYPFNLSIGSDGLLWIGIASPRHGGLDLLARRPPALRKLIWALPERAHPNPIPSIWTRAVNPATGSLAHDLYGPPEHEFLIATSAVERDGTVYLGSVVARAVAALELPRDPQSPPADP